MLAACVSGAGAPPSQSGGTVIVTVPQIVDRSFDYENRTITLVGYLTPLGEGEHSLTDSSKPKCETLPMIRIPRFAHEKTADLQMAEEHEVVVRGYFKDKALPDRSSDLGNEFWFGPLFRAKIIEVRPKRCIS
jgi:hypothetical protein